MAVSPSRSDIEPLAEMEGARRKAGNLAIFGVDDVEEEIGERRAGKVAAGRQQRLG
jgi:hypothetical protein